MKAANIRPITDLKNRTKELVREVAEGGQSVVITQNGKPRVVMMAAAEHDRLQETLAMLKLLSQSQQELARNKKLHSTADVRKRAQLALANAKKR
jgi:prevent-host-death family protein